MEIFFDIVKIPRCDSNFLATFQSSKRTLSIFFREIVVGLPTLSGKNGTTVLQNFQ